jgi:putative ABC transport system permease protein
MTEAFRLAMRDLRGGLRGLGLLWLCLAIAVTAIASVLSLASSIDRAIANNGRQLLGGDLALSVAQRQASDVELSALRALGPISKTVTTRATVVAGDGRTQLAELSGVDSAWPLAGALELQAEGRRPMGQEVALGSELAERLGVRRGERVRIGYGEFRVSGIIDKMPALSGFALAPPALMDEAGLAATRLIQPGSLSATSYRILLPPGADPRAVARSFRARFPDGGWNAVDRSEAGGGTRRFVDRVGQMLLLIALAALAVGGVGIASAAQAFAASRRPAIAVLKLLGAGRRTLGAMLAIELGLIALVALAIGLTIGAAVPAIAGGLAGPALPVAPDPAPQWAALGQSAAFGLLVTLAASWGPVASAVATRPAQLLRGDLADGQGERRRWLVPALALAAAAALAITRATDPEFAATGLGAIAALLLMFAGLGWLIRRAARSAKHRGGPLARLGIAALDRPGAATIRLSVALGLGLSLLVMLAGTGASLLTEISRTIPSRAPALFLVDIPGARSAEFRALADRELPRSELRIVPSLRGPVVAINGKRVSDLPAIPEGAWVLRGDRGLTFARDLPPANRIVAGEWWPRDYRGPPLISLDVDAAEALSLDVGDRLTVAVLGRPIEARIASLRQIDWRSMGFNFAIIFAPGTLEQAPYTLMATVSPPPGTSTAAFERGLAAQLPMVSAIRVSAIVEQVSGILTALDRAVRLATLVAIAMGMVVLAGAVVATRRARVRDLVLLKLVGATRPQLVTTQLIEFALLSSAVALLAFAAGVGGGQLLAAELLDIPFQPDWAKLIAIPFGAVALAVTAALLAALPALNARPARALRAL